MQKIMVQNSCGTSTRTLCVKQVYDTKLLKLHLKNYMSSSFARESYLVYMLAIVFAQLSNFIVKAVEDLTAAYLNNEDQSHPSDYV